VQNKVDEHRHILVQSLLSSRLLSKNVKVRIYKTISLHLVLYGCEIWSLTLREEHRLRVFENRVLRRIFGRKSDKETGGWRKLHNEELRDLYSSPSIIRMVKSRMTETGSACSTDGEKRKAICYWWERQKERTTRKTKT
jgi:hypothetical protein